MSIPLWVHPIAELALVSLLLLAFRLGATGEREWHVRSAWVAAVGLIVMAFIGLAAHALAGFTDPFPLHGWLGASVGALLLRQIWLGRMLQAGKEKERGRHRWNARLILVAMTFQILTGIYYASVVV